ncbi:hypothetical protein NNC19_15805 [Clostridium sp. SHJSY1]|uniref:hypothetical protein n=1 Tax=Clostridium sp. SHJSY1 TaxID=2942483 RepID=UPI002875C696|nr:hypothetical protein [Clostridium sp. SHJSY1]MDS0527156.1 hypothetical protein [Clostridium sp. SHJSY1]
MKDYIINESTKEEFDLVDYGIVEYNKNIKHGYEVFGVLDYCIIDHKRYYMKKNL